MVEAGHGLSAATLHAAGGAHANARRAKEEDQNQDLVRHALVLCGAQAAPGRAPRGNLARALSNAITPDKGK